LQFLHQAFNVSALLLDDALLEVCHFGPPCVTKFLGQ